MSESKKADPALIEAIMGCDADAVEELVGTDPASINYVDEDGDPMVTMAVRSGNIAALKIVLLHGPDLIRFNTDDHTALDYAFEQRDMEMVRLLGEEGGEPTDDAVYLGNLLVGFIREEETDLIEELFYYEIDPRVDLGHGRTAMHAAMETGREEVVKRMIEQTRHLDSWGK
ncbi:MAG: ankyrin repeat domain-containing protein [Bacteroidota bacterium]